MASLAFDDDGVRLIFKLGTEKRKTVRLGNVSRKAAKDFKLYTERLINARNLNTPLDPQTESWLDGLSEVMHKRLARVGLVESREPSASITVGHLLDQFVESATVKPSTMAAYRQTTESLRAFLGEATALTDIDTMDADRWRKSLTETDRLAPATQVKRCIVAKAIFKRAVRWGWLDESPFEHLRGGSQRNPKRASYVSTKTIESVLDACPDARWRAIVGLARYAGLRCPSELTELKWADVAWDQHRLTVRSPKTAQIDGHAVRVVPIAPALMPILQDLYDEAEEGEERVVVGLDSATNLRTHMLRILARAGVKPWPRLFHALRASCACDWVDQLPEHVVSSWLGHSPRVAAEHYLQTRDEHFRRAAGLPSLESGAQSGAHRPQSAANCATSPPNAHANQDSEIVAQQAVRLGARSKEERARQEESGRRGIRTPEGFRRQIYSLFQLSTLASAHRGHRPGGLGGNVGSNPPSGKPAGLAAVIRRGAVFGRVYSGFVQSQSSSLWSLVAPWRMQRRQMMASG